jgi:hypothetical protein
MKAKRCRKPPAKGMIRVFVASGHHLTPQPLTQWSKDGHAWSVLDIPTELYEQVTKATDEYWRTQNLLRYELESKKCFCGCGSDHADCPTR